MRPESVREDYARTRARELLTKYGINSPPVCPEEIIRDMNIELHYHHIPEIDFSFVLKREDSFWIFIHISGHRGRDQWSLAHELGHVVLGHYDYDVDAINIPRLNARERYILEREADIFTEELLMPPEFITKHDPSYAKQVLNVSKEAFFIRVNNLKKQVNA